MAIQQEHGLDPESNPAIRLIRRIMPVTRAYHGQKFFVREHVAGRLRLVATPLFVVVALVETTDLIFAVDSIPAIFAVTQDPFIVYTSNVFAILGLRALYFLLAEVIHRFHYLKLGLSRGAGLRGPEDARRRRVQGACWSVPRSDRRCAWYRDRRVLALAEHRDRARRRVPGTSWRRRSPGDFRALGASVPAPLCPATRMPRPPHTRRTRDDISRGLPDGHPILRRC